MTEYTVAITTAPPDQAAGIARSLVEARLAACVQILPGARSFFHWEGSVADEEESILLCKTTAEARERFEAHLQTIHSYDVPELLFLPVDSGLPAYLSWLSSEVKAKE
ncbi:MAG: divalent-cation tolerance protein CutA [Spirochaetales bacterium]